MAGLTPTGFVPKTYDEIRDTINTANKPLFGAGVDTDQESGYAQIRNPIALEIADLWEALQSVTNQRGITKAEQIQLDNEASVVGIKRVGSSNSIIDDAEALGSEGSIIPQFFQMVVSSTGEIFQTLIEYTIPAVGLQPLIIEFTAINPGIVSCLALELTGTLPSGITAITNPTDATVGTKEETDEEFRTAYPNRLARIGGASLISIVEEVRLVAGVTSVTGRDNRTGVVDVNGLAPYSFEIIVTGGTDEDIASAIFEKSAAGGPSFGTSTEVVVYEGNNIDIKFSRPANILIWIEVDILTVDANFPGNGDTLIEDLILDYGDTLSGGDDVLLAKLQNAVTTIDGILSYTLKFDIMEFPINETNNITITDVERADFDSTRTIVTVP